MQFYARPEHVFFEPGTDRFVGCRHVIDDTWTFQQEPHTVPDNAPEAPAYAAGCRAGAIYAADEPTARQCGVKFVALEWGGEAKGYRPAAAPVERASRGKAVA